MNNFSYYAPTRYIFGKDTEKETGRLASENGMKKVLLTYGGGSVVRSGLLDRVKESLKNAGIEFIEFGGIKPNPTDDRVYEGIDVVRENNIDGLIAVGGGSVIDTAKAIALGALYDGDFWDFYAGKLVAERALPVGVVLTIPAAGSEGSGNSVITKLDGLHKISLRTDSALRPRFAILNPVLTFTLPAFQTASGIADMMAHIMERYFSPTEDVQVTDHLCQGLLRAIIDVAPRVIKNPEDYQARANIMWAGTMAHNGICGCGRVEDWVSHFMEHEISAVYGVTHGAGLTVVYPAFLMFMATHSPSKPAQFARTVFNITETDDAVAARKGAEALRKFFGSLGLPLTFAQLGIENPDISLLVDKLIENKGEIIGGYYRLNRADMTAIYELMK
ncbi:MAG: iron-containing alcohol dehydrogenase [Muribaculaceae bacterium]|nr:iron-containing alcohol dehydrogenase [Muribaculaceae bacterium]